jgi:hypothetical protein
MFLLGAGIGMTMQVMVLAVQNALPMRQMGVGTAANNFMRSMGSVIGVSLFGVLLNNEVRAALRELEANGVDSTIVKGILHSAPGKIHDLPPEIRDVVTSHVARGVADIFLYAIPVVALAWVLTIFLREVPLRSTRNIGAREEKAVETAVVGTASAATVPVAPTSPVQPGATPPNRPVSAAPADLRRPTSHADIQRAVDALAVRNPKMPAQAGRKARR